MTATQTLKLYEIANRYFKNEADSKNFVAEIEHVVDNKFEARSTVLATKEDISHLEVKFEKRIADLIRWMFIFWTGTVITMLGSLLALFKIFLGK